MEDYITYVEGQLKKFRRAINVIDRGDTNEVTPMLINRSLATYTQINSTLNAEYQRKKKELLNCKNRYQVWWDEKYVATRRRLNPDSTPKNKWLAKNEIESELRVEYKEDYLKMRDELDDLEMSQRFILRLLGQWESHHKILTTLSYNMQSELKALDLGEMSSQMYAPIETPAMLIKEEKPIRKKKETI